MRTGIALFFFYKVSLMKHPNEHLQPLQEDTKIRTQLTKSALSDRLISTEMLLYLSTSDVQYFLKSVLYFIHICMFWFLGNQVTSLAIGRLAKKNIHF